MPAAAPRPQGNRREPMTDRGPEERDTPSAQPEPPRTSSDCRPPSCPIPKSVWPLMPAPGFRACPIKKGVAPWLRLKGLAVDAQVSGA